MYMKSDHGEIEVFLCPEEEKTISSKRSNVCEKKKRNNIIKNVPTSAPSFSGASVSSLSDESLSYQQPSTSTDTSVSSYIVS